MLSVIRKGKNEVFNVIYSSKFCENFDNHPTIDFESLLFQVLQWYATLRHLTFVLGFHCETLKSTFAITMYLLSILITVVNVD